jgi:hypothetical protein
MDKTITMRSEKPTAGKCSRCGDYKGALVDEEKGIYLCVKCFADYVMREMR